MTAIVPRNCKESIIWGAVNPANSKRRQLAYKVLLVVAAVLFTVTTLGFGFPLVYEVYKAYRNKHSLIDNNIPILQSAVRGFLARQSFQKEKNIIPLQNAIRGFIARKTLQAQFNLDKFLEELHFKGNQHFSIDWDNLGNFGPWMGAIPPILTSDHPIDNEPPAAFRITFKEAMKFIIKVIQKKKDVEGNVELAKVPLACALFRIPYKEIYSLAGMHSYILEIENILERKEYIKGGLNLLCFKLNKELFYKVSYLIPTQGEVYYSGTHPIEGAKLITITEAYNYLVSYINSCEEKGKRTIMLDLNEKHPLFWLHQIRTIDGTLLDKCLNKLQELKTIKWSNNFIELII
jgi:hypothetical protein